MSWFKNNRTELGVLCGVLAIALLAIVMITNHSCAGGLAPSTGKPYKIDGPGNNEIRVTMIPSELTEEQHKKALAMAALEVSQKAKGFTQVDVYYETGDGILVTKADGTVVVKQAIKIYRIAPVARRPLQPGPGPASVQQGRRPPPSGPPPRGSY